jgi:hypothetical protein
MAVVVSEFVLPFCGDATGEFELLNRALELVECAPEFETVGKS